MKKLEEYKSGEYIKMNDYKAFIPSKINYNWGWDDTKLDKLLAEANRQIGELNAYSLLIPNVDLYIKMHVKIEANKSSRIEGTRTTVEEDLLDVADVNPEKRDDWEEVQNYVKATNYGVQRISEGNLELLKIGLVEVCQVQLFMYHHHTQKLLNV